MDAVYGLSFCAFWYCVIALYSYRRVRDLFPVPHAVTYVAASLGGVFHDSHLEGIAGILEFLLPIGALAFAPAGCVAMFAKQIFLAVLSRRRDG